MIDFTTIIVTWNSHNEIKSCLQSLLNSMRGLSHETIVVDNASTDTTRAIVRTFPCRLIGLKKNVGFGQANNIGLRAARGRYILLLNPDTIVNPHAITTMRSFLDTHADAGVVGPEQRDGHDKLLFTVSKLSPRGIWLFVIETVYAMVTNKHAILFPTPYATPYLNAGCMMTRRGVLHNTAWFDPTLHLYGEEFDYFPKVQARGWKSYFVRTCEIIHYREKSIGQTNKKHLFAMKSFSQLLLRKVRKN